MNYSSGIRIENRNNHSPVSDDLRHAIRHCSDLPMLANNRLIYLQSLSGRVDNPDDAFELAKALRAELLFCAEQISLRSKYPINEIIRSIDDTINGIDEEKIKVVRKILGIPFSRDAIDLARYYTIRLVMEGIGNKKIAYFLCVEPRTVANYINQAQARIQIVLGNIELHSRI